ncbi:MAG: hypothetical protein ACTSRH_10150 [Promethearchaeota archaeon]
MKYVCIKYTGLEFNIIFKTNEFIFIPYEQKEILNNSPSDIIEFVSCQFNKNRGFYVLLKKPFNLEIEINNFSEENLYQFNLLEALINLIFSNKIKKEYIFILEKNNSKWSIKKIFKNVLNNVEPENPTLIFKNNIFTQYLKEIIDTGFKKFNSIENLRNKKDFALRYLFCVNLYLQGKHNSVKFRRISDLWNSFEILCTLTLINFLHTHDRFEVINNNKKNFFDELKEEVRKYSSKISAIDLDCYKKMKNNFSYHMANKINKFLPIARKCEEVVNEYININDIKVPEFNKSNFNNKNNHINYKEFEKYQKELSIKKIINLFYKKRNQLFHRGKLKEKWNLKEDRIEANFIKILEQLFFKILGINLIKFYQMGYPSQIILNIPIEKEIKIDLAEVYQQIFIYFYENYILPYNHNNEIHFNNYKRVIKEIYRKWNEKYKSLINILKIFEKKCNFFLNHKHYSKLKSNEGLYYFTLDYRSINNQFISLSFDISAINFLIISEKKKLKIKNCYNQKIEIEFTGMINDIVTGTERVLFHIYPPYIYFKFK